MSHRHANKRTGLIAGASAVAIAGAAFLLPNADASSEHDPGTKAFAPQAAARLGTTLASALGDNTAGWYYNADVKELVVDVLDAKSAERVKRTGAVAKVVRNSRAELRGAARTLKETASVPGTAWSVDPKTNTVSVLADSTVTGTRMATLNQALRRLDGLVSVKRAAGEFTPFNGRHQDGNGDADGMSAGTGDQGAADPGDQGAADPGDQGAADPGDQGAADPGDQGAADPGDTPTDAPTADPTADPSDPAAPPAATGGVQGGEAIFGGDVRCSLGFNVSLNGAPAFLTAGHCGNDAKTWSSDQNGTDQLGTVLKTTFPVSDFALVAYDDTTTTPPSSVALEGGASQDITQAIDASVGLAVQRSGSTSGLHDGTVTGLDATVNYGNGDIVNGLVQTDVCAEPGDSGGPLFADDAAVGLTSGGSGDCTAGGETFFQPVTAALQATGATIGDAGAGRADDPGDGASGTVSVNP
ncbi:S1 family peptidase [Streptomyces sp. NBC_00344]|uniref:S1 family peptidase n=1 Tax=Streptomyces sp. NBC_00344 TaxID=2975720 RepID=UPI002E2004A7